jgi:NAD(P)-dependent dehydrogenase (short-subunit alcohol dehydrogenase family)
METAMMLDKAVLITGAGRGFGMAMADAFLSAGAHVIALERETALVLEAREKWSGFGANAQITQIDVRDESAVVEFIASLTVLDVVVNNAGIARKRPFLDTPTEELDAILEVNLRAAFIVMREAARRMRSRGGHIINVVSDSGVMGMKTMAPYSASKHALLGLSRSARLELREQNIRVTAFCPGSISTDIFGTGQPNPAAMSPQALASLIVYLAGMPPEIEVQEILVEPMTLVEERYLRLREPREQAEM